MMKHLEAREARERDEGKTDRELMQEPAQKDFVFETTTLERPKQAEWIVVGGEIPSPFQKIEKGKYFSHILDSNK